MALSLSLHSSLEKIFPSQAGLPPACSRATVLRGEEFAFQAVLRRTGWGKETCRWSLTSPLKEHIQVFQVENVPCELAAYPEESAHDNDYLTLSSGLFPDLLRPLTEDTLEVSAFLNTTLWVNLKVPPDFPAGEIPVTLRLESGEEQVEAAFTLTVIPACLPEQKLLYTQWFHLDCLAEQYGVPIYSEPHWELIAAFLKEAAAEGMNTVLTPAHTPPLDTAVGAERPCVQLVEIEKEGDQYRFEFSRLRRFVDLALSCGITHFEIAHLFTQWGAEFTPAIYAVENGERKRIFGWDVPADAPEYRAFLEQYLPALTGFFDELGLRDRLLFHVSDEPGEKDLDRYRRAKALLGGLPVIDALSDLDFYDQGLVQHPVAATNHIEPFLDREAGGLWAYTCCGQNADVGNRFLAMPSYRNRILGLQLYKFRIEGFLQWGYNFWFTQLSRQKIDPFRVTDAGGAFPGGDAFSVYPGEDGTPLPSLRQKVFCHGLQDLRALELLESLASRETVEKTIPGFEEITFASYPRTAAFLLEMREKVNRKIAENLP